MNIHPDELSWAQLYSQVTPFEGVTESQRGLIRERGQTLDRWYRDHLVFHYSINFGVIALLLGAEWTVLLALPGWLLGGADSPSWLALGFAGLLVGGARGWLSYSMAQYALHEGAAHRIIFPPRGRVSGWLHAFSCHLSRLSGADPSEFARNHKSHHAHFGTAQDGEFLSFVMPSRYWKTLLPFAMWLNVSDFVTHRPMTVTRGQVLSGVVMTLYNAPFIYWLAVSWGLPFSIWTIIIVTPHVAFGLDRLRQFSEHNLMPIENENGARSFGPGFWGLLIGGGPWGQPCHWIHHMVPRLPWYQQIVLHRHVARALTPHQRRQFLLEPIVGYPKLLWRLWTEPYAFVRRMTAHGVEAPRAQS